VNTSPYSPHNPLLSNAVVLLPSEPAEYGNPAELVAEIQSYIHRYVDLSPLFERIASYYVLFSWVYDAFPELPYLRVRGDYGSGKSRFLQVVGSICYKPIFARGASTVSPLFRMIDAVRGTLLIDEGDFRFPDELPDGLTRVVDRADVRMLEPAAASISRRNRSGPRVAASSGTEHLQGDVALAVEIAGEVDSGHPAAGSDLAAVLLSRADYPAGSLNTVIEGLEGIALSQHPAHLRC